MRWLWLCQAALCPAQPYDVLVRNGTVYDGSGGRPRRVDVAISGDRIARVGKLRRATARTVVDEQGVTIEVF